MLWLPTGADILNILNAILWPDPCGERIQGSDGITLRPTRETDAIECTTIGEDTMLAETSMTYILSSGSGASWWINAHLVSHSFQWCIQAHLVNNSVDVYLITE